MDALDIESLNHSVRIKVASGGYVVTAVVLNENGDPITVTLVYTEVATLLETLPRLLRDAEGLEVFSKLGPLRCQDERDGE